MIYLKEEHGLFLTGTCLINSEQLEPESLQKFNI